ncbi:MAG: hypothetical protein Q9214_005310 [Letrouitia sp. 1 TL-2023]
MPPDMASSAPRRHVSGASEHQDDSSELRDLLRHINSDASKQTGDDVPRNIAFKIEIGHRIRQLMLAEPRTQDSFRRQRGFETLINLFRPIYQILRVSRDNTEVVQGVKDFLKVCFNILSAALREHGGNQRYFRKRVGDGGWESLNQVLQLLIDLYHELPGSYIPDILEQVFGGLLACAFDDETLLQFYNRMTKVLDEAATHHLADPEHRVEEILAASKDCATTVPDIWGFLDTNLRGNTWLCNPEALLISFNLWMATARVFESLGGATELSYAHVPAVINYIVSSSSQSLVAIHNTNLLSNLLPCLTGLKVQQSHILELRSLALALLCLGITHLEDAVFLYRNASSSPILAELILPALQMSHMPSYVHFDMSLHGFSSVELPDIGHSFPPTESSHGYTLSMWLYVDKFDINAHTTLFGAFDSSQTCFVLVYLERDTKNLILQTSVTSSRPSVRFKSVSFREKQWYYIAIAHRRPRTISSSRASLFVDGEFVEQVKSHYPLTSPPNKASMESKLHDPASRKHNPIQAFVGTPQDLASRLGRNLVSSEWRLGSACLFSDVLNDDLIAVYYELGPRYYGNFQDCLGSFNTYRAAATLKLRNQSLHPGQEQASDIVAALEHQGSGVLPESKIILNLSPSNVLGGEEPESLHGTPVAGHLSKLSARALRNMTRQRCCALAINGSVPSINQALLRPYGFAVFTGNPGIVLSQPLDDATWRIGGCTPVNLNLLEKADTEASIIRALSIVFESIRENWRNSEAMERENGFGILASLLATKLERKLPKPESLTDNSSSAGPDGPEDSEFPLKVLDLILRFLGYRAGKQEESVLNNPLAYRTLLVDSDYWREAAPSVQRLYYEQFTVFAIDSKYSHFNAKRLSRMR